MNEKSTLEPHYSPDDLAAALPGQTRRSIIDAARREGWPHVKIGRRITFTKAQVEQIIAQHTVSQPNEPEPGVRATRQSTSRRR